MFNEKTVGIILLVVVLLAGTGIGWLFRSSRNKADTIK